MIWAKRITASYAQSTPMMMTMWMMRMMVMKMLQHYRRNRTDRTGQRSDSIRRAVLQSVAKNAGTENVVLVYNTSITNTCTAHAGKVYFVFCHF